MLRFKKLLLITTIIFFVGFIPLEFAHGDILEDIAETMGNAIVHAMALAVGAIAGILQTVAANILSFALSDQFISHSGANSSLVQDGWGIVRNFANAALVIGLVIIAINIILGKEEGKAKESLIVFIIAALLINFTPLICGFIIDAVNLLGRSFIGEGVGGDIFQKMNTYMEAAKEVENPIQAFANVIFVFYFSVLTFVIYLLYALLFVVRAIFLWILIIASPIAVATRVFPKSNIIRKFFPNILYWDDWIETFLQWTLMIVPAGLFIYLSNFAMKSVVGGTIVAADGNILQQLVTALFSYIIPIVILYIGFLLTIIAGGSIAAPIGNMGKKAFGATKGAVVGTAKKAAPWLKEGTAGLGGALLGVGESFKNNKESGAGNFRSVIRSFNSQSREVGRGKVQGLISGWGKKENKDYKSRSAANEERLINDPEKYLEGNNSAEVKNEVKIAEQRIKAAETNKDKKKAEQLKNSLASSVLSNNHLKDEDAEKIFNDIGLPIEDFASKAPENISPKAFERKFFVEALPPAKAKTIFSRGSSEQKSSMVSSLSKFSGSKKIDDIKESLLSGKTNILKSIAIKTEKAIEEGNFEEEAKLKKQYRETEKQYREIRK